MINAHTRTGQVHYRRNTEKISSSIRVHSDRMLVEGHDGLVLSFFGHDTEVGAIIAAIQVDDKLEFKAPDGKVTSFRMGKETTVVRSNLQLPGRNRSLVHALAISQNVLSNVSPEITYMLSEGPDFMWTMLAQRLVLPVVPEWASVLMPRLAWKEFIAYLDGFNLSGVKVTASREDILSIVSKALISREISFPLENGPTRWPSYGLSSILQLPSIAPDSAPTRAA